MLAPGEDAVLTATTEPWAHLDGAPPDQAWEHELTRRQRLLVSSDGSLQEPDMFLLPLAADQFIVRPRPRGRRRAGPAVGAEPRTVIAGYPWFTDWGRDTMITLEGLTLSPAATRRRTPSCARSRCTCGRPDAQHVPGGRARGPVPHGGRDALVLPRAPPLRHRHRRPRARRGALPACRRSCAAIAGTAFQHPHRRRRPALRRARRATSSPGWTPRSTAGW